MPPGGRARDRGQRRPGGRRSGRLRQDPRASERGPVPGGGSGPIGRRRGRDRADGARAPGRPGPRRLGQRQEPDRAGPRQPRPGREDGGPPEPPEEGLGRLPERRRHGRQPPRAGPSPARRLPGPRSPGPGLGPPRPADARRELPPCPDLGDRAPPRPRARGGGGPGGPDPHDCRPFPALGSRLRAAAGAGAHLPRSERRGRSGRLPGQDLRGPGGEHLFGSGVHPQEHPDPRGARQRGLRGQARAREPRTPPQAGDAGGRPDPARSEAPPP